MRWPSPWGDGFPGWHLECTAMSTKYLGDKFDIHGGGMDLKFPHHECEIAQNQASKGCSPVNYWMHANMLQLNGQRMSKSTGNTVNPHELLSGKNQFFRKAYSPSVIRFFTAQSSYRSILDLTDDGMLASEKGHTKLMEAVKLLDKLEAGKTSTFKVMDWRGDCYAAMNDDFNSPILISHLFEAVKVINLIKDGKASLNTEDLALFKTTIKAFVFDVLGLMNEISEGNSDKINGVVELLIQLRKEAREDKNWALSDQIRDELLALGIQLKDGREGTTYSIS